MKIKSVLFFVPFVLTSFLLVIIGCKPEPQKVNEAEISKTIINLEKSALDRYGKGDPNGYLEIYANEITYFDPSLDKRIDGLDSMKKYLLPIAGKIKVDKYEMIDRKVQINGSTAILTYNLVDYSIQSDGSEKIICKWNSTEVYQQFETKWKITHSHWSYTKPNIVKGNE